jgi:hypothetical protein
VAAGVGNNNTDLASVEIYDPVADTWTTAAMNYPRFGHTATLLLNGSVLIAGGFANKAFIQTAEIVWCRPTDNPPPTLTGSPATLVLGQPLTVSGTGFRDPQWNAASDGSNNQSATNFPMVQLRRLDNEQIAWLSLGAPFSDTAFTSRLVNNILPGPALATVFVNAVPSGSRYLFVKSGYYKVAIKLTTSHLEPIPIGAWIWFTAVVTSELGIPTGAVQFQLDGVDYGIPVALTEGEAVISLASIPMGVHTVSAVYLGDFLFEGGAAAVPIIQEIVQARLYFPLMQR